MHEHNYNVTLKWTGNTGNGTKTYTGYERSHTIQGHNKPEIAGSSDPAFRGDVSRYNPEDLLVASLSGCHMLWYLSLCAKVGVNVVEYTDHATGIMVETKEGGGHFKEVTLFPKVVVSDPSMIEKANDLHHQANKLCFIANSCNFKVYHKPSCTSV
jgi:organic hydroperoxide reductase OsmC/OhrA